jgi:hypothetical protein
MVFSTQKIVKSYIGQYFWVTLRDWNLKDILEITLFLGPSFIKKSFFAPKCWLFTKESELMAKRNNFSIKEDEFYFIFINGHLLHNIQMSDTKNENKFKT